MLITHYKRIIAEIAHTFSVFKREQLGKTGRASSPCFFCKLHHCLFDPGFKPKDSLACPYISLQGHPKFYYTIITSSCPQNRNRYWSTMVWTMSSKWGLMASNLPRSPNSYCNRVGHQQIARFLLSMQLSLLDSVTL